MGFGWAQKNQSPICIDFGSDSLKLLQVQHDETPTLVAAASADIPEHARKDFSAYTKFVGGALKELLREAKFKGKRAVTSISAAKTYVQHVRISKCEDSLIQQSIEGELRGRLPIDPAGMVIRHVPAGELVVDGQSKQEVICFAASREAVMRQVQTVKATGLEIVGMHCEPMAILESFAHLYRRAEDINQTTLFLDIGSSVTKVLIAHGRELVFSKNINIAGEHFIRELAKRRGVDVTEARQERIQGAASATGTPPVTGGGPAPISMGERRTGAPAPGMSTIEDGEPDGAALDGSASVQRSDSTGGVGLAVEISAEEMLDCMLDDLRMCIGYHGSTFVDRPIGKLVFVGGESRQTAMCKHIAQSLQIPAQLGDPLARLEGKRSGGHVVGVDLTQAQPGWAVAMGLGLLPTNL